MIPELTWPQTSLTNVARTQKSQLVYLILAQHGAPKATMVQLLSAVHRQHCVRGCLLFRLRPRCSASEHHRGVAWEQRPRLQRLQRLQRTMAELAVGDSWAGAVATPFVRQCQTDCLLGLASCRHGRCVDCSSIFCGRGSVRAGNEVRKFAL